MKHRSYLGCPLGKRMFLQRYLKFQDRFTRKAVTLVFFMSPRMIFWDVIFSVEKENKLLMPRPSTDLKIFWAVSNFFGHTKN